MECRRKDDEGGAIEHHPVAGEAAPLKSGVLTLRMCAGRCLKDEDKEVDEGVGEKKIEQVAKSVWRSLCHCFPKILSVRAADAFLGNKNSRKEYDEDPDVQKREEVIGCNATAEKSPDVNPDA